MRHDFKWALSKTFQCRKTGLKSIALTVPVVAAQVKKYIDGLYDQSFSYTLMQN